MDPVRSTWLATTALWVSLLGALAAGTTLVAPAGAQVPTAPAPAPGGSAAELTALAQRRDQLNAAIADLDAQTSAAGGRRDAALAEVARVDERLPENQEEQEKTEEARALPLEARQELIVSLYVRGDPRGQQYLESIASGQFTMEPMRKVVLLDAAEEETVRRLAALDAEAARQRAEAAALTEERIGHVADEQKAEADHAALAGQRRGVQAELTQVDQALARAQANANGDPLTGLPATQHRPALAVKIDNSPDARPQSGLNQADVVFEELVESGITRYIAVFHSTDADVVGPVRSGRTSDLVILTNLNRPLFGSSGGNSGVLADLNEANLSNVIENRAPSAYYRDNSRDAPHNLYTSTAGLYGANPGDAGEPPHLFRFLGPTETPAASQPVSSVDVQVGNDRTTWTWIGTGWERTVNGRTDVDDSGAPLRFTNVIVQFTNYGVSSADANSPEAEAIGNGEVWVLSGGKMTTGTWSRPAKDDVTVYQDGTGQEIGLQPGRTWIALTPPGRASAG